jgi:ribose 5-phosphate isomerase A
MATVDEKTPAAKAAVALVENGMVVGLGTGSTATIAIKLLGDLVKEGLEIKGIPTSTNSAKLAKEVGIPLTTLEHQPTIDIDIDGADEVDPSLNLIKGGGGALLHEKIVAYASKKVVIIVDSGKLVRCLGKFRLPVEIVPFAYGVVKKKIHKMKANSELRKHPDGQIFRTDEGNWILDCDFGFIDDPAALAKKLSGIPGIVEHGLFIDMVDVVLVGEDGCVRTLEKKREAVVQ